VGAGGLVGCHRDQEERVLRLEVEEGADSWARVVSDRGRGGGARQRRLVGLGRGPGEGARGGSNGPAGNRANRPNPRKKIKAGKNLFSFFRFNFQITFPNNFQILSKIYQNHSSQKYLCNSMHA
jgi:hypothetical protein